MRMNFGVNTVKDGTLSQTFTLYKVRTIQQCDKPELTNTKSLICRLIGCVAPNPDLSPLKYGRRMEPLAKKEYIKVMNQQGHTNVRLVECGLFVDKSDIYLGASPDAVVKCDCCGTGLLECKCPLAISALAPNADNLNYLVNTDAFGVT